jgi:hypothetical protein
VNGENFPDGLAAGVYGDRILLVRSDSIPAATRDALQAILNSSSSGIDLRVVGGTSAVSSAVVGEIMDMAGDEGQEVDYFYGRLAGDTRYDTAIAVASDYTFGCEPGCSFILATGENFPDALAAGPLAWWAGSPIILNSGGALLPNVKAFLAASAQNVTIVGGTSAVPATVEAELVSMGINVDRIAGDNRAETATAINTVLANGLGWPMDHSVVLVNQNGFADALAAGPFATLDAVRGTLQLVNVDSIPASTAGFHVANCATLGEDTGEDIDVDPDTEGDEDIFGTVFAVGGTAVVSDAVLDGAAAATKCGDDIMVTSATVSYQNVQDQACLVFDSVVIADWTDPESGHDGPVLVPVAGSAADGPYPDVTEVDVFGSGTAVDEFGPDAFFDGSLLVVDLGETTDGMTQARFVELWSSIPEAAVTFTAIAYDNDPNLPPLAGDTGLSVFCTDPLVDLVFEMTFNQPVGSGADFETTPYGHTLVDEETWLCDDEGDCGVFDFMLFTIFDDSPLSEPVGDAILAGDFTASWLWDAPDADGNTTFTMTVADIAGAVDFTDAAGICLFEPCFAPLLVPGTVSNASGVENEFLAGSLYPSDGSTLTWTEIDAFFP